MEVSIKLKVKKVHEDAVIPKYSSAGAACFDLFAVDIGGATKKETAVLNKHGIYGAGRLDVKPGEQRVFRTGLKFEVPDGYVMKIYSRSGHGFGASVRLANCVGVIDSDYRGEVKIALRSDAEKGEVVDWLTIKNGDRIAQAMLERVERVEFEEVEELSDTVRGEGGFGSTGA